MLLLATQGLPQMEQYRHPNLGRLLQPRHYHQARETHAAGFTWAADNDAYQGWTSEMEQAYEVMIDKLAGAPGCKFVTCPDVFGEAGLTNMLFEEWAPQLLRRGLPPAYVLQDDGVEYEMWTDANEDRWLPWGVMSALFIGGSDDNHYELATERLVREAKRRGLWVHMGRVNSLERMKFAASIGCDSVDGTQWVRWRDRWLQWGLDYLAQLDSSQQRLEL